MTLEEKLKQAYWYSYLLMHLELAEALSPTPNKAIKHAAKCVQEVCPVRNIRLLAGRARRDILPTTWLEKQRKEIAATGMTMEDWYHQGILCGEAFRNKEPIK